MNKLEFISYIAETNSMSKSEAEKSLNVIIDAISSSLAKGEEINLVGFGSFKIQKRPARKGRNPKTGDVINIAASNSPVFKVGKTFKDACN
ncbi:MAG: HU family DNA-binding protein [Rickettsiaceae bacterium]|nr:HU family DNA-binding protein [Rickettsiaceae bacterium]